MPSTAKEYFCLIVEPTVNEFIEAPGNIRRGLLAAMVLNHLADYVALEDCNSTDRFYMTELVSKTVKAFQEKCPEFQFIHDVADASKHAKLATPKKSGPREVSSSGQVTRTPGIFGGPFGVGVFAEAVEVIVELRDGSTKPLLPSVKTVLAAWALEMIER